VVGELADAGGLACAVDAHHHEDRGGVRADFQRALQRPQEVHERVDQEGLHGHGIGGLGILDSALEIGQQMFGGGHPRVGHQQRSFQFLVEGLVNARAREDLCQALARLAQASLQARQPARTLSGGRQGGLLDLRCPGRA